MGKFNQQAFLDWCYRNLKGFRLINADRYLARCPCHNDNSCSLRVFANTAIFLCFGACANGLKFRKWYYHQFCRSANLEPLPDRVYWIDRDLSAEHEKTEVFYLYTSAGGENLFKVVRSDKGKQFPLFRFDPASGLWLPGADGQAIPLYHLDELTRAENGQLCLFVEGEKDTDAARSLGYLATTKAGGACVSELTSDLLQPLARLKVAVIPDNDQPGQIYALTAVYQLLQLGARAALVQLPAVADIRGGDLSDFIKLVRSKGGDPRSELDELIKQAFKEA